MTKDFETILTRRIWSDPDFAELATRAPEQALAELGITIPEGVRVNIVVQRPDTLYFAIPPTRTVEPSETFSQAQMDIWCSGDSFIWINSADQAATMLTLRSSVRDEAEAGK